MPDYFSAGYNAEVNRQNKRAAMEQQKRVKGLEFLKDFRPMLEQAAEIEDDKLRKSALGDLFAGYAQRFGQEVNEDAVKWIQANPQQFRELLDLTAADGMRLDQIFPLLGDPLLRGSVTMALEKGARTRAGQGALAGTNPSSPQTGGDAAPQELGMGQPVAVAGEERPQPATAPATPAQSPLTGPTPALETQAQALEAQIANLDQRIQVVAKAKNTQGVTVLEQQRNALQQRLAAIREAPALAEAAESRQPAPMEAVRETAATQPGVRSQLRPGMTRGELQRVQTPAPAAGAEPAPAAAPNLGVRTPGEVETEQARIRESERVAGDAWKKVRDDAELRRKMKPHLQLIAAEIDRAGPTGAITGPLRQGLFNVGQLLGVDPKALSAIQNVEAGSIFLASQLLKDFSGPDSDRDFLRALEQNPGIRKVPEANRALLALALQEVQRAEEKAFNANRWVATHQSLLGKDPKTGDTFDEGWAKYVAKRTPTVSREQLDEWMKKTRRKPAGR